MFKHLLLNNKNIIHKIIKYNKMKKLYFKIKFHLKINKKSFNIKI